MTPDRETDPERMRRAEREVGKNIPDEMIGLDSEDVRDVDKDDEDVTKDSERARSPGNG